MFSRLSLRFKLLAAFLFVSLLLGICGSIALVSMNTVVDKYDILASNSLPNTLIIGRMRHRIQDLHRSMLDALIATDQARFLEDKKVFEYSIGRYQELTEKYLSVPFLPGEEEIFRISESDWKKYSALALTIFERIKKGDVKTADFKDQVDVQLPRDFKLLDDHLEDVLKFHEKYSTVVRTEAHEKTHFVFNLISLMVAFGFFTSMVLGYMISQSLTKTLGAIGGSVHQCGTETRSASQQLSTASHQLSSGSAEAAASLEETVASLEELTSMVKVNSGHAKEANSLSKKSKDSAEKGEQEIHRLISAMNDMADGSKKIENIIAVIDDIAFQTNLLALNAAVEAARAGEQGKGFAVVADAVRTLAQRSASAAKDISNLIKENVDRSLNGASIAEQSGAVLSEIVSNVKKVSDLNNEISSASEEQSRGLEQISQAMNQLDRATQDNAAASEEVAAASEEMASQASQLMSMVLDLQKVITGKAVKESPSPKEETVSFKPKTVLHKPMTGKTPPAKKSDFSKAEGF
jgi:methyl-accepting chemotaxis protein